MRKTSNKTKIIAITFLTFLIALAIPMTNAQTAAITLDPTTAMPGDSVTVEGTDFATTSTVGIGFGAEMTVTGDSVPVTGEGAGPWTGILSNNPIKPGTFELLSDTSGVQITYTDNGDGTLSCESAYFVEGTINYTSGVFSRTSTVDLSGYELIHIANYTCYENSVTPEAGVTTDPSGNFTASITVPSVVNGDYDVTAIDDQGNFATSTLPFEVIPEGLTFGVMVLLSSVSVLVGSHYIWNRSRKREK